jgi:hypothetical protein
MAGLAPLIAAFGVVWGTLLGAQPAGLAPRQVVPEGVSVLSTMDRVEIKVDWAGIPNKPLVFFVIVPSDAPLDPRVEDFSIQEIGSSDHPVLSMEDLATSPGIAAGLRSSGLVECREEGFARFWRIARVSIKPGPVQESNKVFQLKSLKAALPFDQPPRPVEARPEFSDTSKGYGRLFPFLVANPEAMALYADRLTAPDNTDPAPKLWSPQTAGDGRWWRFPVGEDGFLRLTKSSLEALGLNPAALSPDHIQIYRDGQEIPALSLLPSSAPFDDSQALVFYARASKSVHARESAHYLRVSDKAAPDRARIPLLSAPGRLPANARPKFDTVEIAHFERDDELLIQQGDFLSIKGYNWVWKPIPSDTPVAFPFRLHHHDPRAEELITAQIAFHFEGLAPGARPLPPNAPRLAVHVNESEPFYLEPFANAADTTRTIRFSPSALLPETTNTLLLRFESPLGDIKPNCSIHMDYFDLKHQRLLAPNEGRLSILTEENQAWHKIAAFEGPDPLLFDMTDPGRIEAREIEALPVSPRSPLRTHAFYEDRPGRRLLTLSPAAIPEAPPATQILRTSIRDAANEADYLIIYHPLFEEETRPLVAHQESRGLKTLAVSIDEVFQEFSLGENTPHAVKDFLNHALRNWRTPPLYVLLVGDASSDYRNELRFNVENLLPAYTHQTPTGDKWASELWYATLLGCDLFPDVLLGRFSVRNKEDAAELVRKTIEYQTNAPLGPWRSRVVFSSDHTGFREAVDRVRSDFRPHAFKARRIYLEEYPWEDNFYIPDKKVVRDLRLMVSGAATLDILETINRGASLVFFMGHGSPNIWTNERIWFGGDSPNSDNRNLRNAGRLPFVATFTCNQGAFDYPKPLWHINISEDMMRVKDGGAVALYVPSGPGYTSAHEKVAQPLMQALYRDQVRRVGEAVALSRLYFLLDMPPSVGDSSLEEMLLMYVLLGDPALDLVIPKTPSGVEASVQPEFLSEFEAAESRELEFQATIPELKSGRFVASVYDADDHEIVASPALEFQGGQIAWRFRVPENSATGEYAVRVYYGNDEKRLDGVASAVFRVQRPRLGIHNMTIEKSPAKPGDVVSIGVLTGNESRVAARGATLLLRAWGPGAADFTTLSTRSLNLEAGQFAMQRFEIPAPHHLNVFEAVLENRFALPENSQESPLRATRRIMVSIPRPASETPLFQVPAPMTRIESVGGRPGAAHRFQVPLLVAPLAEGVLARALLRDRFEKVVAQTDVSFSSSTKAVEKSVLLEVDLRRSKFEPPFSLLLEKKGATEVPDAEPLLQSALPLPDPELPDLRFLPQSVRLIPNPPEEGRTIFIEFEVENAGRAAAPEFHIRASARSETGAVESIRARPLLSQWRQNPLGAGQKRLVRLRWDNDPLVDVAGDKTLEIELDTMSSVEEIREDNNILSHPFRILSRPNVKIERGRMESRIVDRGDGSRRAEIKVYIHNEGESAAANMTLGIFRKAPDLQNPEEFRDPAIRIKEIELEPIKGLETVSVDYQWTLAPDDTDSSPTAHIYIPSRAIRARSLESATDLDEWRKP